MEQDFASLDEPEEESESGEYSYEESTDEDDASSYLTLDSEVEESEEVAEASEFDMPEGVEESDYASNDELDVSFEEPVDSDEEEGVEELSLDSAEEEESREPATVSELEAELASVDLDEFSIVDEAEEEKNR